MATKRCQQKAYELLERSKMRRRAMVDFILKQREILKLLELEFTLAGVGMSGLGLFESYQSGASFRRVENVVGHIQLGVDDIRSDYGDFKLSVQTSFDELENASDRFSWRMAGLEASVAIANACREAEHREVLSLYEEMVGRSEVQYRRPDTIIKEKFRFWG